jgi:hypothetical protein
MYIKVRKAKYKILFVDEIACDEPNTLYLGLTDCVEKSIKIRKSLKNEMLDETIIHELTHAFHFEYNAYYFFDNKMEFLAEFLAMHGRDIINATDKIINKMKEGQK